MRYSRRNPISVFVDEDHSIVRRTKAFVQEWHDRDMDKVFADMGARVDVSISGVEGPDSVSLDLLEATSPRKGAGRRALRTLLALTDKHDLTVTLVAQPLNVGSGAPISQADLIRFYKRFGFDFDERVLDLPPYASRRLYHDFGHYQMVRFPYANTYEDNPRRRNPRTRYVYHLTYASDLPAIARQGLVPRTDTEEAWDNEPGVYFVNAFGYEAGAPESEEPAWLRFPAPDGLPPRFFVGMNEAHANRTFAPETLDVWVDERGRPAAKADGVRWSPLLRRR